MNVTGYALAGSAPLVSNVLLMNSAVHARDMERPDSRDLREELWAGSTATASNPVGLPDVPMHPGDTVCLMPVDCAPPFPSPPGPPAEADFEPAMDDSSGKDLWVPVAGFAD